MNAPDAYLTLAGVRHRLIPLRDFRQQHDLPPTFSVGHFEPKDLSGLGRIDGAGPQLNALRDRLVAAVPSALALPDLPGVVEMLETAFARELTAINTVIGLRQPEIDFAAAGVGAVLRLWVDALIRHRLTGNAVPDFACLYAVWLDDSTRLSQTVHPYAHAGQTWQVQIINNAYGRCGLRVQLAAETVYVADNGLACPAAGFMVGLLRDLCQLLNR